MFALPFRRNFMRFSNPQRVLKITRSQSLLLPALIVVAVLAGYVYWKKASQTPLDATLTERFPALAEKLATHSSEFRRVVRQVQGHDTAGFTSDPTRTSEQPTSAQLQVTDSSAEQKALRLVSERQTTVSEVDAFYPLQYNESFVIEGSGVGVVLRPLGAMSSQARIENKKVVYRDAYRDTDSLHALSALRSEEFLYLRSANAPRRFEYELSEITGARQVTSEGGAIRFQSEPGRVLQIERPWLVDGSGKRRNDVVRWELAAAGEDGKRRLSLVIEDTAELSYPLVIDPTWGPGAMNTSRLGHTATLLRNGKVLIVGGTGGDAVFIPGNCVCSATAELYDPSTGGFSFTGSLHVARAYHTATLLQNGKVLVTGGGIPTSSAELYDPDSGTWSATGDLTTPRQNHTATLLTNGKVLLAGGYVG